MATSGRITSHFLTWYSTHSLLMVMSPSKKWKRGLPIRSLIRSVLISIPYTSQSVVARMRLDKWCPMKPFTPRIKTFFISSSLTIEFKFFRAVFCGELCRACLDAVQFEAHHAQQAAAADGISPSLFHVEGGSLVLNPALGHQRLQDAHVLAHQPRCRARIRRRYCAHQIVYLLRRLRPVDDAIFRLAPAEISA